MKPEHFEGVNRVLNAPANWDEAKHGKCEPLPIQHSDGLMVSCWSLSMRERWRVLVGGRVWMVVVGDMHPAVALSADRVNIAPRAFFTEDEIVEDVLERIESDPAAIKSWLEAPQDSLIQAHHTVGRDIRNQYGLWDEKNPHVVLDPPPNEHGVIDHPNFPDQVSQRIIERVWRELRGSVTINNVLIWIAAMAAIMQVLS